MNPLEDLEERIVIAVLVALREGQGIAQPVAPSLPRETPPNNPPPPSSTPPNLRKGESRSTTFSRESAHVKVDDLDN